MARSLVDPVEDWLLRKLREMQLDDWVVEGLASSAMVIEDKDDVLLTLQNFFSAKMTTERYGHWSTSSSVSANGTTKRTRHRISEA